MTNPDAQLHVFSTFLGIPPDSTDLPVCGARLTSAYNGKGAPKCPACLRVLRRHQRRYRDMGLRESKQGRLKTHRVRVADPDRSATIVAAIDAKRAARALDREPRR